MYHIYIMDSVYNGVMCISVSVHFHYLEVWEGRKEGGREGEREFCLVLSCTGTAFVRNCRAQPSPVGEPGIYSSALSILCLQLAIMVVFLVYNSLPKNTLFNGREHVEHTHLLVLDNSYI